MTDESRFDGPSQQAWASAYWLIREIAVARGLAEAGPDGMMRLVGKPTTEPSVVVDSAIGRCDSGNPRETRGEASPI